MKKRPAPERDDEIVRHSKKLEITESLGFKSPLAYVSSFTFIARKDGVERKYLMYEGEERNTIDLLSEIPTEAPNGVKVIIPVNFYDRNDFYKKIKEQLCYFENVYFDVNVGGATIDNDFKITRYNDFQLSELGEDSEMHLCLDNVYYPLDFKKLGIDIIKVPVALRFGLSDGIFPIPNRESIRYSKEAKEIIKEKIVLVASKMVEMYNSTITDIDDIKDIISYYSSKNRYIDVGHKKKVDFTSLIKYSLFPIQEPKLKGVVLTDLSMLFADTSEFLSEYDVKYRIHGGRMREERYGKLSVETAIERPVYKFSDILGGRKKEYIKSISPNQGYSSGPLFIKKTETRKLFTGGDGKNSWYTTNRKPLSYASLLHLRSYPKSEWRARIAEYEGIIERITSLFIDVDNLQIPQAWIDSWKKKISYKRTKGHTKLEGEISCKLAADLERYVGGKSSKMIAHSIDLAKAPQTNCIYIYTGHDKADVLDKFYEISKTHKTKLVTFSERELKKIDAADVHNLISYDKFMKGDTKPFKRIVTAYLIHKLREKYSYVFRRRSELTNVSSVLSEKLITLYNYEDDYYRSGGNTDVLDSMLAIAEVHNLFDYPVYDTYLEIKRDLEKLPFLETLCSHLHFTNPETVNIIVDMMKYHKYKVNLDKYKLPLSEKDLEAKEEEEKEDNN